MSIYKDNDFEDRKDYLNYLSDMYGIDKSTVYYLANMLGSNEDFDGLVTTLEDMIQGY